MAKKLFYKIGEACKRLDVQPYVLRYWETEFPALSPSKSKSGQRVYSEKDLQVIARVKELLYDEGYTIAGAKKKLEGELASGGIRSKTALAAAEEARKAQKKKSSAAGKGASKSAAAKGAKKTRKADSATAGQVEKLRKGVQEALDQAREILALLDSGSPSD